MLKNESNTYSDVLFFNIDLSDNGRFCFEDKSCRKAFPSDELMTEEECCAKGKSWGNKEDNCHSECPGNLLHDPQLPILHFSYSQTCLKRPLKNRQNKGFNGIW